MSAHVASCRRQARAGSTSISTFCLEVFAAGLVRVRRTPAPVRSLSRSRSGTGSVRSSVLNWRRRSCGISSPGPRCPQALRGARLAVSARSAWNSVSSSIRLPSRACRVKTYVWRRSIPFRVSVVVQRRHRAPTPTPCRGNGTWRPVTWSATWLTSLDTVGSRPSSPLTSESESWFCGVTVAVPTTDVIGASAAADRCDLGGAEGAAVGDVDVAVPVRDRRIAVRVDRVDGRRHRHRRRHRLDRVGRCSFDRLFERLRGRHRGHHRCTLGEGHAERRSRRLPG